MTWELLWQFVLVAIILLFAIMAATVTILGARDIRRLLRELQDQDDDTRQVQGNTQEE